MDLRSKVMACYYCYITILTCVFSDTGKCSRAISAVLSSNLGNLLLSNTSLNMYIFTALNIVYEASVLYCRMQINTAVMTVQAVDSKNRNKFTDITVTLPSLNSVSLTLT